MQCVKCNSEINSVNIYQEKDIYYCGSCDKVYSISESIRETISFDIKSPPDGAWFKDDCNQVIVGGSIRSSKGCFLGPFALIFTTLAIGGIYVVPIFTGKVVWGLLLVGIPFAAAAFFVSYQALLTIFGKVEFTIRKNEGQLFTGIGTKGFTKKFDIRDIFEVDKKWVGGGKGKPSLAISLSFKNGSDISFGSLMSYERKNYLYKSIRELISNKEIPHN